MAINTCALIDWFLQVQFSGNSKVERIFEKFMANVKSMMYSKEEDNTQKSFNFCVTFQVIMRLDYEEQKFKNPLLKKNIIKKIGKYV